MPINLDSALGLPAAALALRARRAEVLAANLANSDTPHYKARDFDFQSVLQQVQGASPARLETTHEGHIASDAGGVRNAALLYRTPSQPSLDGNAVDPQLEKAAFMENAMGYQLSLRMLDSRIRGLMTALRGE